ncbi:MAG TPA: hypothetical protein VN253_10535 [Kofleriaceae bacterium]|nr:hypothetical protein [Kofleriaceae bacterium]
MRPAQAVSRSFVLLLLTTVMACTGAMPPPPELRVTSPKRGMVQGDAGRITVQGTALPGSSGAAVAKVTVNKVPATLTADGSFTAVVDVAAGATLLETVATSADGGSATDARAVQVGQLRPVGSNIERAVTASLSADSFARLSAAAGPIVKSTNIAALLAPLQPMANLGDSLANLKLSITKLTLADAKFKLTPVDGGLEFFAELGGLSVGANVAYGGTLVPDGATSVNATADKITIAGTLVVTPAGTAGFTTKITSPTVGTANLRLQASGLTGQILNLLNNNLGSTIQSVTTRSAELALQPLINDALGTLAGPQRFDVLGKHLDLQASPSAITFSRAGALVTINLATKIEGSESSPGYIFTPNGTPTMNVGNGIQVGLADDLVNELLAEVHAIGLLDLHLKQDFGVFDTADIKLTVPPMISANSTDGALRLVLGDMIASFSDHGKEIIRAAVNAQVDLQIKRGNAAQEIALQFGKVRLFVNVLDTMNNDEVGDDLSDLSGAAAAGIGLQLDSLSQFLITVPVPSVAGVSLDNLALRADSGYVMASGQIH